MGTGTCVARVCVDRGAGGRRHHSRLFSPLMDPVRPVRTPPSRRGWRATGCPVRAETGDPEWPPRSLKRTGLEGVCCPFQTRQEASKENREP